MKKQDVATGVVAVIPARGGSKSIPRKNLLPLFGAPLLAFSIDVARQLSFVKRVIVSTEDEEIAKVATMYGAEIVQRPPDLASDYSRDDSFLTHLLTIEKPVSLNEVIMLLRPTHPIRNPLTLSNAYSLYLKNQGKCDSLRSMKKSTEIIFKTWTIDSEGFALPAFDSEITSVEDPCNAPRQLLPDTFYQDGYVEIFPLSTVEKFKSTSGTRVLPFIVSEYSQDVDYVNDVDAIVSYFSKNEPPNWFRVPKKVK